MCSLPGFEGGRVRPSAQESVLQVPTGKTLSLIGGDIEIIGGSLGFLAAPGGRIQLASVASPGEVLFNPLELAPDLQVDAFARLGRITLSQDAILTVSGDGGGTVLIRSGRLLADRSTIIAETWRDTDGASSGIDLQIAADVIANHVAIVTGSRGAGRASDLRVTAGSMHLDVPSSPLAPSLRGMAGTS